MEYIHQVQDEPNSKWKNGNEKPDILKAESIVICDIDGGMGCFQREERDIYFAKP